MYNEKQAITLLCHRVPYWIISLLILSIISLSFAAKALSAQVTLAWDPNTESSLSGYRVHY